MRITGANLSRRAGCSIVTLETDAGVTGTGIGDAAAGPLASKIAAARLTGADPRGVAGTWQRLLAVRPSAARASALRRRATAILDLALWDLKARANGEPLWRTLGGARPRAIAYASSAGRFPDEEKLAAWFTQMAKRHGVCGGKLRVGRDRDADLRRLARMQKALANPACDPVLMIDAAGRWSAIRAVDRLRALERKFDLTWIEGVARNRDLRGLQRLSDRVSAAVCVGAGLAGVADFRPHFQQRSADVIQIDIGATGITAALQIADAAYGLELPVTLAATHGNIQALVAGVMPNCMSVEIVDPEPPAWIRTDVRIEDGRAIAGDRPGNGLRVEAA